jgi:cytochrome c biogenesis protein CcmG/thiol:disulfide interchange protein DsbE
MRTDGKISGATAVAVLIAIASSVLLSFNVADDRWPAIDLPSLDVAEASVNTGDFAAGPAVINFWASWCVGCRQEHPVLESLAASGRVALFGVNHLDERDDALRWLGYYGDPYDGSVFDAGGAIRYRHSGPLDSATVETIILPLVENLRRER